VPHGYDEIVAYYGDPTHDPDGWWRENVVYRPLPFVMRVAWRPATPQTGVWIHHKVADSFLDALIEIRDTHGEHYLHEMHYDYYGGLHNHRLNSNDRSKWSMHAFAAAFDYNPHIATYEPGGRQPEFIVAAFERRGWVWVYVNGVPRMHVQAAAGY